MRLTEQEIREGLETCAQIEQSTSSSTQELQLAHLMHRLLEQSLQDLEDAQALLSRALEIPTAS